MDTFPVLKKDVTYVKVPFLEIHVIPTHKKQQTNIKNSMMRVLFVHFTFINLRAVVSLHSISVKVFSTSIMRVPWQTWFSCGRVFPDTI